MPTVKQKSAVKKLLENRGMGVSRAMADSEIPYAPKTAKNPKNLTNSKGWAELMAEYLPNSDLAKKHKQLLNSEKEEIAIKALDLGHKVQGNYSPEKVDVTTGGDKLTKEKDGLFSQFVKSRLGGRRHPEVATSESNQDGERQGV